MWKVGLLFVSVQGYIFKMHNNLIRNRFPRHDGYKDKILNLYIFFEGSHPVVYGQLFIIISAVFTQHIKSVALLQLVTFGYMFRPLPSHHQANKE